MRRAAWASSRLVVGQLASAPRTVVAAAAPVSFATS
jgi:hypothetical protein